MTQTHTPGPWAVFGRTVTTDEGQFVADVFATSNDTGEANARLIAAAPEMLAALRRFLTSEREGSEGIRSQAAAMARVVLADIEGRAE